EVAAHLDDLVDGRDDEDGARGRAEAARRARPEGVLGEPVADELPRRSRGIAIAAPARRRQDPRRRLVDGVPQPPDEDLGIQGLVRQRRRADDAATAALRARVAVEARLPGELLDPGDAKVL